MVTQKMSNITGKARKLGSVPVEVTKKMTKRAMNGVSKVAKGTTDTVSSVTKQGMKGMKRINDDMKKKIIEHTLTSVIVFALILYSSFVINYFPLKFLVFFENIIVKIVVLIIIALVGIYSPAIALFLAIALIVTLQQAQKRKLSADLQLINTEGLSNQEEEYNSNNVRGMNENTLGASSNFADAFANINDEQNDNVQPMQPWTLGNESQDGFANNSENDNVNSENSQVLPYNDGNASNMNLNSLNNNDEESNSVQPMQPWTLGNLSQDGFANRENFSNNNNNNNQVAAFNQNDSCLNSCKNKKKNNDLSSPCGNITTWKDQISAQGLDCPVPGYTGSVGSPV